MADIANLGLAVDARPVSAATAELDRLTQASKGAKDAAAQLNRATAGAGDALKSHADAAAKVNANVAAFERQTRSASQTLDKFGRSTAAAGTVMGLTANQARNLSFQINDVFTSLSSGAPAMQVLAQQGGQIYQALGEGPGGVTGALKGVGKGLVGVAASAGPAIAAIGGVTGAVALAGVAWARWESAQERVAKALDGIGRGAGVSVQGINRIAEAAAKASGMSNASARDVAAGLASSGRIGPEQIASITGSSKAYARVTGQSIEDATAELAKAYADPSKGLDILNGRLGVFDDRIQDSIRSMQAQGNLAGAQTAMWKKMQDELATATDRTWSLTKAWQGLKDAASNGMDALGQAVQSVVNPTLEQQIAKLEAEVAKPKGWSLFDDSPSLPNLQAQQQLDALKKQLEEQKAADKAKSDEIQRAARSTEAGALAASLSPEASQLKSLQDQAEKLQKAIDEGLPTRNVDQLQDALGRAKSAAASMLDVNGKLITQTDLMRERQALEIKSINARTAADKAAIAVRQQQLALFGQHQLTDAEQEAIRQTVYAQTRREATDQLRSANDNLALSGLPSYQRSRLEIEQRTRDARESATGDPASLALVEQKRLAEIAALNRTAITQPVEEANRSLEAQARLLEVQAQTFGKSTREISAATKYQELLNTAVQNGITVSPKLAQSYQAIADATGRLAEATEKLQEAQQKVIDVMDNLRGASNDVFGGFASDIAKGNSAKQALSNLGGRLGDRLIGMGSGSITEGLFGRTGKPGGGLFGDAIGQFVGQGVGLPQASQAVSSLRDSLSKMTIGQATIMSGSVTVTGSLGAGMGGVGGLPGATGASGGMSGVLGLSRSFEGLNENRDTAAISGILSASGTAQLDPKTQAWCAAYANAVLAKSGLSGTGSNMASSFLNWGQETKNPGLGDIVNIKPQAAGASGHVGFFGGYDAAGNVLVSGGNQSDSVKTSAFPVDQVVSFRTALTDASKSTQNFGAGLEGISSSLANSFTSTAGAAAGGGGGGGGLFGWLGSLFKGTGGTTGATAGATMGFATGGRIVGPGTGTSDSILARVSNGESIINARSTAKHWPIIQAINADRLPGFAAGGSVDTVNRDFSMGRIGGAVPSVTIGGNSTSIIVQGNADNASLDKLRAELDRRDAANDAALDRKLRRQIGGYNKAYSGGRG